ncbi:MAG: hypothetical protein AB8G05_14255 [Oligoflexales bacterium]
MSRFISSTKEPLVGLDEPVNSEKDLNTHPYARVGTTNLGWRVFGFGSLLCLLILGMFSLGFIVGQGWEHRRADLFWMKINQNLGEQVQKIAQKEAAELQVSHQENPHKVLRELKAGLVQMHELGEELKLKIIDTHSLYAGMVGLPEQLKGLEELIKQWEASKISLVEDLCPASENLPRMLPANVKTATK